MSSVYWRRRGTRHAWLACATAVGIAGVALLFPERLPTFRLSMGTAYVSLGWFSVTLLLGAWNVLRNRANPVSTDVRRDIGIWAAVIAALHVVFGLQVHLKGEMQQYFLWAPGREHVLPFRYDAGGVANYAGLGSMAVLLVLMALSNDASLRRFGTRKWKALQRLNYGGFALMALHGAVYQYMEKRWLPWIVVFAGSILVVSATQLAGFRKRLRQR